MVYVHAVNVLISIFTSLSSFVQGFSFFFIFRFLGIILLLLIGWLYWLYSFSVLVGDFYDLVLYVEGGLDWEGEGFNAWFLKTDAVHEFDNDL